MPPVKAPSGVAYRVNGYINDQHLIDRVETWVDHDMLGDMHVDTPTATTRILEDSRSRPKLCAEARRLDVFRGDDR